MKTKDEIYCYSFKDISEIIACTSEDEVVSREDSYKVKRLLEKCYLKKDIKGLIGKLEKELTSMKSIFYLYAIYGDEEAIKYNVDFDRMDDKTE